MTAAIASKGFSVIGVDRDKNKVEAVEQGRAPIFEPHLDKLIKKYRHSISATADLKNAVLNSDISFIVVPTPSKADGEFSLSFVNQVAKETAKVLAHKKS
jgi:UDPglucose 6-dehydrogenase